MLIQSPLAFPELDRLPVYDARTYGLLADGTTDDTAAFQAALTAAGAAGGGKVILPSGTIKIATSVALASANPIILEGQAGTILDGSASTANDLLTLGGSRGVSAALTTSVSKGGRTLVSSLVVAASDLILVTSTDVFDPEIATPKGEMVEVQSVSGTTITLKSPLADSYTNSTTTLHLLSMPRVEVRNVRFVRNSAHRGLKLTYARDVHVQNCSWSGCRERCLWLLYCHRGTVQGCAATDIWTSGTTTAYGIAIDSCQHFTCVGNHWFGGRHGIKHGGFEPTRWVQHLGGSCDNDHANIEVAAVDVHGNGEFIRVSGMWIGNGVGILGRNCVVENCTIEADTFEPGIVFYAPTSSDYQIARGNQIRIGKAANGAGIAFTPREAGVTVGLLDFSDNLIAELPGLGVGNRFGVLLQPLDSTISGVTIGEVRLRGNRVRVTGSSQALRLTNSGAEKLAIEQMAVQGGSYRAASDAALLNPTLAGVLRIEGAEFSSEGASATGITVSGFEDVYLHRVHNSGVGATPIGNTFLNSGKLHVICSHFEGWVTRGLLLTGGAQEPVEVLLKDTNFPGCGPNVLGTARVLTEIGSSGNVIAYGTAAPTTHAWLAGDVVRNTGGSGGEASFWYCILGGTPGTWVASGIIPHILDRNRELYWNLAAYGGAGSVPDSSGNGNVGPFPGGAGDPAFSVDRLVFTTDDFMDAADAATLDFAAADSFTLLARFSIPAHPASTRVLAAKKSTAAGVTVGYALYVNSAGLLLGSVGDGTLGTVINSAAALTAGQVYTVALVRDVENDRIYLAIDGVRDTTATDTTAGTLENALTLSVGHLPGSVTTYLTMSLYRLTLHRRVLTGSEMVSQGAGLA